MIGTDFGTDFLAVPEQQAVTIATTDRVSIVNTSTPSRGLANLAFADGGGKDMVSERRVLLDGYSCCWACLWFLSSQESLEATLFFPISLLQVFPGVQVLREKNQGLDDKAPSVASERMAYV